MKLKRLFSNPFESLYAEARLPRDIRRSINLIVWSNIFGNLHCVVCGSGTTSMIGLANYLGAGDFIFGLLTGIPMAAALLQIPFSIMVSRRHNRKRVMMTYGLISRAMWLLIGIIPYFVPMDPEWLRIWTIVILIGISSCLGSCINVCWFPWMADLVPINIRGRWISTRDMINSIGSVIFGLFIAYVLDHIPEPTRYTIVFTLGGILGVLDMLQYARVKEVYTTPPSEIKFFSVTKKILRDRKFMRFLIFWTAWCFTANLSGSFLNRYALNEMGLSYMELTIFSTIASAAVTVLVIKKWGKLMDMFGCKSIMWAAGIFNCVTQLFYLFSVPGSIWPTFLHNAFGAMFWSATNLAATSMQLTYSPDEERPTYVAFFSCVVNLAGSFLGVIVGGACLDGIQSLQLAHGWTFDRYKLMIVIAVALRLIISVILIPMLDNDREATTKDLVKYLVNQNRMNLLRLRAAIKLRRARRSGR